MASKHLCAYIDEDVRRSSLHRTASAGLLELDNSGLMTPKGSGSVHDMQNVIWTCCPTDSRLHDGGPGDRQPPYRRPSHGKRRLLPSSHSDVVFFPPTRAFITTFTSAVRSKFISGRRQRAIQPDAPLSAWPRDPRYVLVGA